MGSSSELSRHAAELLADARIVVIANREPWIHRHGSSGVEATRSPGGLVTGVEPILDAVGGTWVAHGSGDADFEVADEKGRIEVPPGTKRYLLSRVELSPEEVDGYYERFANQVLWPLCHLVFVRPRFDRSAFEVYRDVNRRFADRASEEINDGDVVMVQDYHFALLPAMLRERRPSTRMSLFWHIPWPPAEVFERCPWAREIVEGMLGANLLGFHTQKFADNFCDTARLLGVGRESGGVIEHATGATRVAVYPISVEWSDQVPTRKEGQELARAIGIPEGRIALGVDRIDYTKGILQRLDGIAGFLRRREDVRGQFTYIQLGSPSRTAIEEYRELGVRVAERVREINQEFGGTRWTPVIYEPRNISADQLALYFAMADIALVTPLHDGMNLVAKEYVVACSDNQGALILSRFAGAAEELSEAILVNPWSSSEIAGALEKAVDMSTEERVRRMTAMRETVRDHDLFSWAGRLLSDTVRSEHPR